MLMEVKRNIQLIFTYFKFNLSSAMEYRVSFLIQTFGMILNNASFIFFWWILFEQIEEIGGYGFEEVMMLWAIASTSFGIVFVLFGNLRRLARMIMEGELDPYLLQPKDVLVNILASRTIVSAWGDIFYGYILFVVIQGFNLKLLILFTFFNITATCIFTSVLVIAHSLAFYIGNAEGISGLVLEFILTFSIYPEGIFKGIGKLILYTIIPAAYVTFVPIQLILNFSLPWFLGLTAIAIGWVCLAYFVFNRGLKRYESGNLIVQKL